MEEEAFRKFLKRGGRSPSAIQRVVAFVRAFERYLNEHRGGKGLDDASPADLETYVAWVESEPKASAKTHLWALGYYYEHATNEALRRRAGELRQERIKRKPFQLKKFRGVNLEYADKLASIGITDVEQMLQAGRTPGDRRALSAKTGIPLDAILEFVKLSDLARIGAVRGIRARLYYDAGVDTVEKMAGWDPEELRAMLITFVERTGFDGIAPLPKEARNTVSDAQKLPQVVEY